MFSYKAGQNHFHMKLWRRALVLVFICICLLLVRDTAIAENHEQEQNQEAQQRLHEDWASVNELAQETQSLVERKDYAQAKSNVQQLAEYVISIEMNHYVDYPEQAQMVLETILQAKEALTAANIDEQTIQKKVLKMRLALDAVAPGQQPMWLDYFTPIEQVLRDMQLSIKENERDHFYRHLNRLAVHYELIRPSILMSHSLTVYEQTNSHMSFFFQEQSKLWQDKERTQKMIETFHDQLKQVFYIEPKEDHSSFWILLFGLSLLIISALSYAGWRKYRAEQERKSIPMKEMFRQRES